MEFGIDIMVICYIITELSLALHVFLTFFTGVVVICETMAFKPKSMMDIDIDSSTCQLLPLKRYNSAPYINTTLGDIHTSSESMTQTIGTIAR